MSDIVLRRPCPEITEQTPLCAILRLAKCHGIGYKSYRENDEKYIQALIGILFDSFKRIPRNNRFWKGKDLSYIARFVNSDVETWSEEPLFTGFKSIFKDVEYSDSLLFGPKTNHTPESYDEVQTYTLCTILGITTHRKMSFPEMIMSIRISKLPTVWRHLIALPSIDLFSISRGLMTNDLTQVKCIPEVSNAESDKPFPRTNQEAILLGVQDRIDFSLAKYPLIEYYIYRSNPESYIPVDAEFKRINEINPYRLKFSRYFNPSIPLEYYTWAQLNHFRSLECIQRTDNNQDRDTVRQEIYEKLCTVALCDNFYHLIQPEIRGTCTENTWEEYSEVKPNLIVSYGVLSFSYEHYSTNSMKGYTIPELSFIFRSTKNFIDPSTNVRFTDQSIEKLNKLCICMSNTDVPDEVKREVRTLTQEIYRVKHHLDGLSDEIRRWVEVVEAHENKSDVISVLGMLLDVGMYMRTWKGPPEPYPLDSRNERDQDKIFELVNFAMAKFMDNNDRLSEDVGILKLPLYVFERGNFVASTQGFEGLTIQDRINKVCKGESTPEMSSCIRMSSNWLIGSAYYYLQLLGCRPNFNIEDMHTIA